MTDISKQVVASTDDAIEASGGTMYLDSTANTITAAGAWYAVCFLALDIPQGATIQSAIFQFYLSDATRDDVHFDIYAEDIADAPTFAAGDNNISNRTRTTAKVDWDDVDAGAPDWIVSVDISSVIQEIVDDYSIEDVVLIFDAQTDIDVKIRHWDYGSEYGAKLDITYASGVNVFRRRMEGY